MPAKILIVEDDEMNVKFFEMVLTRKGGYEVVATEDVDEILNLASSREIDLILMDISLDNSTYKGEQIDGIGITRLLKEDHGTSDIPVLLATAHAMKGSREEFLEESGADDYISKPVVDYESFLETVSSLLNNRNISDSNQEI
jgi:CheY-like chemotaxis protein